MTIDNIASYLEHTLLSPEITREDVEQACRQALENNFAAIVIRGCWVKRVSELLSGSSIAICSSVGATTGLGLSRIKALEAAELVREGCNEIDVYINMNYIKSGMWDPALADISETVKSVKDINNRILVKIIVENGLLYESDKKQVYLLCKEAGADYIKTNSGFVPGIATSADVRLIRHTVGPNMGIKAAGHIYDYRTACEMIEAGANRIGTTTAIKIVAQEKAQAEQLERMHKWIKLE